MEMPVIEDMIETESITTCKAMVMSDIKEGIMAKVFDILNVYSQDKKIQSGMRQELVLLGKNRNVYLNVLFIEVAGKHVVTETFLEIKENSCSQQLIDEIGGKVKSFHLDFCDDYRGLKKIVSKEFSPTIKSWVNEVFNQLGLKSKIRGGKRVA